MRFRIVLLKKRRSGNPALYYKLVKKVLGKCENPEVFDFAFQHPILKSYIFEKKLARG